jgi:predicted TIM-barrel fold metal-dependent hydrolase
MAGAAVALQHGAGAAAPEAGAVPVIDSHIHLFDNTRPVFSGYMGSPAYRALAKPSLPSMYEALARPAGVVGAIVVESSGLIDDNLWYLEVCRANPFMVGVSGSLDPGQAYFGQYLSHFPGDPLQPVLQLRQQGRRR